MNNEPTMSGRNVVGLIIPPPDIRSIVEKTAQFVAKNGIDFENRIKEKEANNTKFSFLAPTDPYHNFYRSKVAEYESGQPVIATPAPQLPQAVKEHVKQAEFVPTHPPPAYEFNADPATINSFDLDLIRMTAMYVARNGRQFLTGLMNREVRNFQFDFLKPQHSNFGYFTKLVEQYTKVIIPPKSVIEDLSRQMQYDVILGDVKYRVAWEKHQKQVKEKEDKALEEERMAYNSIDWHDFVVVQTVDFQPNETANLPPLCTQKDVGARILMQQRNEAAKAAAEAVEMEMDSDSEDEQLQNEEVDQQQHAAYEVTQPAPAPPTVDSAVVRDYDPKKAKQQVRKAVPDKYIISPLTNERVSADKLHDHIRYNTVDPQFKEQRDREMQERQDEDTIGLQSGTEIARNITRLAEKRTDIFGTGALGAEQAPIGQRLDNRNMPPPANPKRGNVVTAGFADPAVEPTNKKSKQ